MEKLPKNVLDFIDQCSEEIGKFSQDNWNINLWNECQEMGMESPIEQILYCALKTIRELNYITPADIFEEEGINFIRGLNFYPQNKIGKFRVDFLVGHYGYSKKTGQLRNEVVVECDSQQFHDRNEQERRYEKQRDRFLQSQGYKVFRFTGSEIVKNPLIVAREIIAFVCKMDEKDLLIDSNLS